MVGPWTARIGRVPFLGNFQQNRLLVVFLRVTVDPLHHAADRRLVWETDDFRLGNRRNRT